MPHAPELAPAGGLVADAAGLLAAPGLVVIAGGPGAGRSTALRQLGEVFRGPVFAGGGLAMLRTSPAFALTRAVRVRLPAHDPALLAEAVRSRVRGGLLVLDDLQWADPATLAALPQLAAHCRVAAALRTPHRIPPSVEQALRSAATGWLTLPPLTPDAAEALVRRVAPGLPDAVVASVVARAGGVPLALESLARHVGAVSSPGAAAEAADGPDQIAYAVAQALADLTRPARTAMAALGLLGRPATAGLLGEGVDELASAGLVTVSTAEVTAVSPYVAEVAAGLLDAAARQALHRRLAELVPPAEAARHLAAAGDSDAAYARAVQAAAQARTTGERADLLLLACQLGQPPLEVRVDAARTALACGRPRAAARVLDVDTPLSTEAAVLRGEALLQLGEPAAARDTVAPVPDDAPAGVVAGRDRVLLLTGAAEPGRIVARHGELPAHTGLRAALAAIHAGQRRSGWEHGLASTAAAAGAAGDALTARWSAWLLVETLAADGRLTEAATTARSAAAACAADLAYSWQTRFVAADLWCTALHGHAHVPADQGRMGVDQRSDHPHSPLIGDEVVRRAGDLIDRSLPAPARGYAVAAASLVEADGGLLGPARARLAAVPPVPGAAGAVLDWVAREAAWLDGQPDQAAALVPADPASPLVDGLRWITAQWAAYETGAQVVPMSDSALPPVRETLAAWAGDPDRFARAAKAWHDLAVREEVRCLLALGLRAADPAQAIPPLRAAERLAEAAGLVVLLGRARRGLRRWKAGRAIPGAGRPTAGRAGEGRSGAGGPAGAPGDSAAGRVNGGSHDTELTGRERDVLRLVARGEPTRRIAGQLGISGETVETHIRAGMRKLGARTRTEAAARALEVLT